ncbi:MAG: T9SS type A sorting domain-containing protein, partial [Bacteroidetes bacterium]|nr:T9SS type A sorting domain-containing protein [Bacteroidota bacterium]
AQGARVYQQEMNTISPTIDITSLSAGIYLVEVTSAEKSATLKFVKK